jgi:hypothetical protein
MGDVDSNVEQAATTFDAETIANSPAVDALTDEPFSTRLDVAETSIAAPVAAASAATVSQVRHAAQDTASQASAPKNTSAQDTTSRDTAAQDDAPSLTTLSTGLSLGLSTAAPAWQIWELNEQLRHVERVLQAGRLRGVELATGPWLRFDPARPWSVGSSLQTRPPLSASAPATGAINQFPSSIPTAAKTAPALGTAASLVIWLALGLGMAALACGVVLAGWGIATHRDELWNMGLPIAMVGQLGLVAGLLLQLLLSRREARPAKIEHPAAELEAQLAALEQRLNR